VIWSTYFFTKFNLVFMVDVSTIFPFVEFDDEEVGLSYFHLAYHEFLCNYAKIIFAFKTLKKNF